MIILIHHQTKKSTKDENKLNVEKENIDSENQYSPKEETKIDKIINITKNAVDTSLSFISSNIGSPFIKISQKVNLKCVELLSDYVTSPCLKL